MTDDCISLEARSKEEALAQARMYVHTAQNMGVSPHKILRSYKLDETLVKAVDQYAATNGKDKSDIVADAIKHYLHVKSEEEERAERLQRIQRGLNEWKARRDSTPCPLCNQLINFYEMPPLSERENEDWIPNFTMSKEHGTFIHIHCPSEPVLSSDKQGVKEE
jgi:predicted transcriptional regulator